jgi:hypothetical protein
MRSPKSPTGAKIIIDQKGMMKTYYHALVRVSRTNKKADIIAGFKAAAPA